MQYRENILRSVMERLQQLGLEKCSICGADEQFAVEKRPAIIQLGQKDDGSPEQIKFLVSVGCPLCGHVMLFDVEQFHDGNDPILE